MSLSPFTNQKIESVKPTVTSIVSMEPVQSVLTTMSLLTMGTIDPEKEPWLAETVAALTAEQRSTNQLIFAGLGAALILDQDYPDFPAYLKALASLPATVLRDRVQERLDDFDETREATDPHLLLSVREHLDDPAQTQQIIVEHLQTLWKTRFASQWAKLEMAMHTQMITLNSRTWPTDSASAVIRAFIRHTVPDEIVSQLGDVRHVIFVPSPYLQFYSARLASPDTLWLFMYADFWVWPMRVEPTKKSEIRGPVSALADDTRLQILEMLAAYEEMRAQEIIAQLDVSQPTVSRHLKQLCNARFITEQRTEDANKSYRLNRQRIGELTFMLDELFSRENARLVLTDIRLEQPPELRAFLDRDGLVTQWPAKRKSQQALLDYLIAKFDQDKEYTEPEVNEVLDQWHIFHDPVYLRRLLVDAGMLDRLSDGSRYWLPKVQ